MSPVDEELLSAYLDGALNEKERLAFEGRLAREPSLQAALNDLRRMTVILKATPQLAPPRNFTLDTAVYRRRSARLPTGWLRLGAALAAIFLVMSLAVLLNYTNRDKGQTAGGAAVAGLSTAAPSTPPSAARMATSASESSISTQATVTDQLAAVTPLAMPPTPTLVALFAQATALPTSRPLPTASVAFKQSATQLAAPFVTNTAVPTGTAQIAAAQASGSSDNAAPEPSLLMIVFNFIVRLFQLLLNR